MFYSKEQKSWVEISVEINRTKYELKLLPTFSFKRIKL